LPDVLRSSVWRCPTAQLSKDEIAGNIALISYGYNAGGLASDESAEVNFGLGGHRAMRQVPLKDSEVVNPSDMIAIGDVFVSRLSLTHEPYYANTLYAHQRHQGLGNVVFCDGHVESPKLQSLFMDTNDVALSRWNYDHQPHHEVVRP
jgi:prepilin-type processing-associated H-X9-DG protein